ncbi:MAG: 16S rRNA (cytosine(967)-C(5))-methyltransferase RsmB [Bacteroidota bacterium]
MQEITNYSNTELYRGVRGIAVKILNRIDRTDAYLEKLLEAELRNPELSGPDKSLLFEIVHGVIRWSGRIDWILNSFYKGQFSKCIPNIKNAMRVALYQILFLDRIPEYAAVNEAVEFIKRIQGQKPADLTNAVLRNIIRNKDSLRYPDQEADLIEYLSVYYSHPSWMIKRWIHRFDRTSLEALLAANNSKPQMMLRCNTLKTTPKELSELLESVELSFQPGLFLDDYFRLKGLSNITDWEYFTRGYFTIQDESTGFACRLMGLRPGMRVLDLCAAPGGKTAYMAALMNDSGEIIALDKYESRLRIMDKNMKRLGLQSVKTVEADALEYEAEPFDAVLLDAPCSGLGTLSKKPDIKLKRDQFEIRELTKLQSALIDKAAALVKSGGTLVYSTCTIEPEENTNIINGFLQRHTEFTLCNAADLVPAQVVNDDGCVQTYPHIHQMDGAFAARLVKT